MTVAIHIIRAHFGYWTIFGQYEWQKSKDEGPNIFIYIHHNQEKYWCLNYLTEFRLKSDHCCEAIRQLFVYAPYLLGQIAEDSVARLIL